MFQKLMSRFQKSDSPEQSERARHRESLREIILSKSSIEAAQGDPHLLVSAVVDYVNFLINQGKFTRDEIPSEAMQVFHTDYYATQVIDGGHAQFIGNSLHNLPFVVADIGRALEAIGAERHRQVYNRMQTWIAKNPEEVEEQTGFEGGIAPALAALDPPFFAAERKHGLSEMLAEWILHLPNLRVVDDAEILQVLQGLVSLNPDLPERSISAEIARIGSQLSDESSLGFGLLGASMSPPEPLVHMGNGVQMDIAQGHHDFAFAVKTVVANRFCVRTASGFDLYERIDAERTQMPALQVANGQPTTASEHVTPFRQPKVGALLNHVPHKLVEVSALVCRRYRAAAALDLMLRRLPEPAHATFASVRSVGKGRGGRIGATILIVADDATRAFSAVVESDRAQLLVEPSHELVMAVGRREIDAHAAAYSTF